MSHQAPAVTNTETDARPRDRRSVAVLAIAVLIVTTALTIYGASHRGEIAIVMALIVVALGAVYGYLLPRELAKPVPSVAGLVLSIAAIALLLPTFWSGQSLLLGAAGAMLGYRNRKASTGAGRSIAALLLGLLASIGYLAIYAMDALLPPGT